MIKHIDWDLLLHRTASYQLPSSIDSIEVKLDGGRVNITINGQEVFNNAGDGTRDCTIRIDGAIADAHDWMKGSGSPQ